MQLYKLNEQYQEALRFFEDNDIDQQCVTDTLEALEGEIKGKCLSVAMMIETLEASASAKSEVAKRQAARAKAEKTQAEWLRKYLADQVKSMGISKLDNDQITLRLNKPRKRVIIDNENDLPDSVMVVKTSVDKTAVKRLLDSGEGLSGAHLEDGDYSVTIK